MRYLTQNIEALKSLVDDIEDIVNDDSLDKIDIQQMTTTPFVELYIHLNEAIEKVREVESETRSMREYLLELSEALEDASDTLDEDIMSKL